MILAMGFGFLILGILFLLIIMLANESIEIWVLCLIGVFIFTGIVLIIYSIVNFIKEMKGKNSSTVEQDNGLYDRVDMIELAKRMIK